MKPGDQVVFHMVPMHICAGGICRCMEEAAVHLEATVVTVHPREDGNPQALALDVDMPDNVLLLGYSPRQAYSLQATTKLPESGTWTER